MPDELADETYEPQLDYDAAEEGDGLDLDEEPSPLTALESCKMDLKSLGSQLVRNIIPNLEVGEDGSTSELREKITKLQTDIEVNFYLYVQCTLSVFNSETSFVIF